MKKEYYQKKLKNKQEAIKKKTYTKPAEKLASILPKLCDEINFDSKVKEMSVIRLWQQLLEEPFKTHCHASAIKSIGGKTVLQVSVENSAMASELSFNLDKYKLLLNEFSKETDIVIDDIRVRVGK